MAVDDLWYLTKRGPGEERIPSQRNGRGKRWRVRWNDDTGKPRQQLFTKKTDADKHDAAMRADVSRGTYIDPRAGKVTLRAYGMAWLDAQTFDPSTREAVEVRLRVHVYPFLGDMELRDLAQRPSVIQAWVRGRQQEIAPNYVRSIFANLSAVLGAAFEDRLILRNPCRLDSVKAPAKEENKVRPWPMETVNAIRAGMPPRFAATVDCGNGLGQRQGEVFGLAVDDIDWLRRVVHVRHQVKQIRGQFVFAPPKGGKERDVPLSEIVSHRLAAHLQQWPAELVTLPWLVPTGKPVTLALVFTNREHNAVNRNYFNSHLWKPALVAAKLLADRKPGELYEASRELGFHALRHTFASTLLSENVDIRALAAYLGHTDPGFTLRVYCHLMPSAEDKTRKAIDRAMGAAADGLPPGSVPDLFRTSD
jgi:integrase